MTQPQSKIVQDGRYRASMHEAGSISNQGFCAQREHEHDLRRPDAKYSTTLHEPNGAHTTIATCELCHARMLVDFDAEVET